MRPKKNPGKDLNSKRVLYFVLGLLIIMTLIYIALEWKTQEDNHGFDIGAFQNKEILKEDSTVVIETQAKRPDMDNEVLSFAMVEEPPIFPGCEKAVDKRACFNKMIQKHIIKNFRYPGTTENLGLYSKNFAHFMIKKDGSIDEIKIKGPAKSLETMARHGIEKLPLMTPARSNGKAVNISYGLPVNIHWKN